MARKILHSLVLAVFVLGLATARAGAYPPDTSVYYDIRSDPSDGQSSIILTVQLDLVADSVNGSTVNWDIVAMHFTEYASGGDIHWDVDSPNLSLWSVQHANTDDPISSEFGAPPSLSGAAIPQDPNDDELDYSFVKGTCDSNCQQMYGGAVTAAAYSFDVGTMALAAEPEPEPVEVIEDETST